MSSEIMRIQFGVASQNGNRPAGTYNYQHALMLQTTVSANKIPEIYYSGNWALI
jgi:hypothetical protein